LLSLRDSQWANGLAALVPLLELPEFDNVEIWRRHAQLLRRTATSQEELYKCQSLFERALRASDPTSVELRIGLSEVFRNLGDEERAHVVLDTRRTIDSLQLLPHGSADINGDRVNGDMTGIASWESQATDDIEDIPAAPPELPIDLADALTNDASVKVLVQRATLFMESERYAAFIDEVLKPLRATIHGTDIFPFAAFGRLTCMTVDSWLYG
jgi:hypothetical protein